MTNRVFRNLAVALAMMFGLLALIAMPASAQDSTPAADGTPAVTQPVTVGETDITWEGDWEYDQAASLDEQATFSQIDMETAIIRLLSYGEFADDTVEGADQAIDVFTDAFFEGAGLEPVGPRATGELEDGSIWRVYDLDLQGTPVSFLISANVAEDGQYVIASLTANSEELSSSLTLVQEEFTLNEDGQIFEGLTVEEVDAAGSGTPAASPAATPAG